MRTIRTDELKTMRLLGREFFLIDVLPADEFPNTRIHGARNVPLDARDFPTRVEQVVRGKDATVVVYCASADCSLSTKAAERLEAAGFTDVCDYKGGAQAWLADQQRVPVA